MLTLDAGSVLAADAMTRLTALMNNDSRISLLSAKSLIQQPLGSIGNVLMTPVLNDNNLTLHLRHTAGAMSVTNFSSMYRLISHNDAPIVLLPTVLKSFSDCTSDKLHSRSNFWLGGANALSMIVA